MAHTTAYQPVPGPVPAPVPVPVPVPDRYRYRVGISPTRSFNAHARHAVISAKSKVRSGLRICHSRHMIRQQRLFCRGRGVERSSRPSARVSIPAATSEPTSEWTLVWNSPPVPSSTQTFSKVISSSPTPTMLARPSGRKRAARTVFEGAFLSGQGWRRLQA